MNAGTMARLDAGGGTVYCINVRHVRICYRRYDKYYQISVVGGEADASLSVS
jgi:hypothetical protein